MDPGRVQFGVDHHYLLPDFVMVRLLTTLSVTPVTRSAASRPDSSAVGTPTPGTVEDPASTALSTPRTVLAGNGLVWAKVCASANRVPGHPRRAQSVG